METWIWVNIGAGKGLLPDDTPFITCSLSEMKPYCLDDTWWCCNMETLCTLMTHCEGNSLVTSEFDWQQDRNSEPRFQSLAWVSTRGTDSKNGTKIVPFQLPYSKCLSSYAFHKYAPWINHETKNLETFCMWNDVYINKVTEIVL